MSDKKNPFDPEKIILTEYKMVKGQVDTSEDFDLSKVEGFKLENELQFGFNLEDKLIKTDFLITINTDSKGLNSEETKGNFHFIFIYHIQNLEKLATTDKNDQIEINPLLGSALASITYSTSRGILLTRLQGTSLQNFILPVVNPNDLFRPN